jgi:hypothetical protein
VEALLDGEAEKLTRKAIKLALAGDSTALRLCLERIAPVRRGRTVELNLPSVDTATDVVAALGSILGALSSGGLTTEEATAVASLIELKRRAIETTEIESRLRAIEERIEADEQNV